MYDVLVFLIVQSTCGWLDDAGGMIEEGKELEKKEKCYKEYGGDPEASEPGSAWYSLQNSHKVVNRRESTKDMPGEIVQYGLTNERTIKAFAMLERI